MARKKQDDVDRILDHYVKLRDEDKEHTKVMHDCYECTTFSVHYKDGTTCNEYPIEILERLLGQAAGFYFELMEKDRQELKLLLNKEDK